MTLFDWWLDWYIDAAARQMIAAATLIEQRREMRGST